jgi:hypothetical protein
LGDLEQSVRRAGDAGRRHGGIIDGAACRDQRAHIHIPLDDRAVERGDNAFERCQILESLDVGYVWTRTVASAAATAAWAVLVSRDVLIDRLLGDRPFRVGR